MEWITGLLVVFLSTPLRAEVTPSQSTPENIPQSTSTLETQNTVTPEEQTFPVIFEAYERAVLPAQQAGKISSMSVNAGDPIQKGQILAEIDHRQLVLEQKRLEARRVFLQKKVANLSVLNTKGLSADIDLLQIRQERAMAEAESAIVAVKIDESKIKAPFDGFVIKRHVNPYEWTTLGQPVLEVLDTKKLRVVAHLPAEAAVRLEMGESYNIYVPDLETSVEGVVSAISPSIEVKSNTVLVMWSLNTLPPKLRAGMKGTVMDKRFSVKN